MKILERGEVEERMQEIAYLQQLMRASAKRLEEELSVIDQWLKTLEFRLMYMEEDNED